MPTNDILRNLKLNGKKIRIQQSFFFLLRNNPLEMGKFIKKLN